jgi:hypothetical protein
MGHALVATVYQTLKWNDTGKEQSILIAAASQTNWPASLWWIAC